MKNEFIYEKSSQLKFIELLKALLVEEMNHSQEDAERLVASYPQVVINGIMGNNLRACVMVLEMVDKK